MAEKKKLSVAEILAAARGEKGGGSAPAASAPPVAESAAAPEQDAAEESAPVVASPAAKAPPAKPATKIKPGSLSVADMLAAARGQAKGPAPAEKKPAAPKPAAEKPVAKPAAEKPAAAKAPDKAPAKAAPAKAPSIDTASILAAARGASKPGPISKAAAAQAGTAVAEKSGKKKLEVPPLPTKPAFAQPAPAADKTGRRGFFAYTGSVVLGSSLAIGFASLAVTHLLWALGLARFMFPNILTEPPSRFKVGFPDELALGQVDERFKAQFGVWIVKSEYEGQPQIFAIKTVCTHLGCTPNWLEAEQKFKCPCHGSGFYKDGINFEGPAPRPLERYAIRVSDDGQLEVDKSRVFHEELGQWKESASYVPA